MKIILGILLFSATMTNAQTMMVRISEIEILPEYWADYNAILKKEAAASVEKEKGVVAIFPMSIKQEPTQIRIVEIYADSSAYQAHLKTPHFQHYKTTTLKMVKALKLVDMYALDPKTMSAIFKKLE
ncbi:putative quinol monooxygenase [Dyadobacter subterraneus]|nr:antibiotic biosynthesis monooxygenase family protein [Dyadobacter subterraneus]